MSSSFTSIPSLSEFNEHALLKLTENAVRRISHLLAKEPEKSVFRIGVLSGGCSGFQYDMKITTEVHEEDTILAFDHAKIVIDPVSSEFLQGCSLDFVETLASSAFEIKNPQATARCGCGNSFSL